MERSVRRTPTAKLHHSGLSNPSTKYLYLPSHIEKTDDQNADSLSQDRCLLSTCTNTNEAAVRKQCSTGEMASLLFYGTSNSVTVSKSKQANVYNIRNPNTVNSLSLVQFNFNSPKFSIKLH